MAGLSGVCIALTTFPTVRQGQKMAEQLVRLRLAACVNIVPGIRSVFLWKGKLERASECLLVIKTTEQRLEALRREICRTHPYEVPEVLALSAKYGHARYLKWVQQMVRPKPARVRGRQ